MKARALTVLCNLVVGFSQAQTPDYLKGLLKAETDSVPLDSLHEIKNEGEIYVAQSIFQITADVHSEGGGGLWGADVKAVRYTGILGFTEEIISCDLKAGKVESRLTIDEAKSILEAGRVSFDLLGYDSNGLVQFYLANKDQVRGAAVKGGGALGAVIGGYVGGPDGISKGAWIGEIATDQLLTVTEKKLQESGYQLTPEGDFKVPQETLRRILPGTAKDMLGAAMDVNDCAATEWKLVWEWGTGYQTVECVNVGKRRELARDKETFDRDLAIVEGLVRKSSMISSGLIFPPALQPIAAGKSWKVDASAFAFMLAQGVPFESLEGTVALTSSGHITRPDLADENANTGGNSVALSRIVVHPGFPSSIRGRVKEENGTMANSFEMGELTGNIQVVNDDKIPSHYVREASLGGQVHAVNESHAGNLWRGLKVTGDGKVQVDFHQLRIVPTVAEKTVKK